MARPDTKPPTRGRVPLPASVTAAGRRLDLTSEKDVQALADRPLPWQKRSLNFYDPESPSAVGEAWFAGRYVSESIARVRIYAGVQLDPAEDPVPVDSDAAVDAGVTDDEITVTQQAVARLDNNHGGQADILRGLALNDFLCGESYLVGRTDPDAGEVWEAQSVEAVRPGPDGKGGRLLTEPGQQLAQGIDLTDGTVVRIWRRHPRFGSRPDAAMGAALTYLEDLWLLTLSVRAAARSRIPAGALLYPEELAPEPLDADDGPDEDDDGADKPDAFAENLLRHMTEPLSNPADAAALVPFLIRGGAEYLDKIRPLEFGRDIDTLAVTLRNEARQAFAATVDLPADVLTGKQNLNDWCTDAETEILTEDGWKHWDELSVGDVVLTLNHVTGLNEWQPVEAVNVFPAREREMIRMSGSLHSSLTTASHRWPTLRRAGRVHRWERDWRLSGEIQTTDRIVTAAPAADLPSEAKWSDAFVETVAWFWTEGSADLRPGRKHPRVSIVQSHAVNPENTARIRRALTALYGPAHDGPMPSSRRGALDPTPRWRETHKRGGRMTVFSLNVVAAEPLLAVAPDRVVRRDFIRDLTAAQLELFIDASIRADGTTLPAGTRQLGQSDPNRLDGLELAAVLAGYSTNRYEITHPTWKDGSIAWFLSIRRSPRWNPTRTRRPTTETHDGIVWCPTTPNGTWFARRDGTTYYTGNSAFNVDEETFRVHLAPHIELIAAGVTSGYFRPALFGLDNPKRFCVWYDASALVSHPNQAENTKDAHDRILISDAVARQGLGFPESAAPDAEEYDRRAALKMPPGTVPAGGPENGPPTPQGPTEVQASARGVSLGYELASLERDLMARLLAACDAEVRRALERAGAKLVRASAARSAGEAVRSIAASATVHDISAKLGPGLVAALGHTPDDLLNGAIDSLEPRWDAWVAASSAAALRAVQRYGTEIPEAERDQLDAALTEGRSAGWAVLAGALAAAATRALFRTEEPRALGERDATSLVTADVLRDALSVAGGGPRPGIPSDEAVSGEGRAGLLSGDTIRQAFTDAALTELGWVWVYGDPGARMQPFPLHEDLDGETFSTWEDPILANPESFPETEFLYPGDHEGCFPAGVEVSGPMARGATLRRYEGEMVEGSFASGEQLTATPNHPVLTRRGWVPFGELMEGDEVVRCVGAEGIAALVPGDQQVPALIEDVVASFGVAGRMVARRVPVAAEDFHGDGSGSEVAVVWADGPLWRDVQPTLDQEANELLLPRGGERAALLAGLGGPAAGLPCVGSPPLGVVGGGGHREPFLDRGAEVPGSLPAGAVADRATLSDEESVDGVSADALARGETLDRFAGVVAFDKVRDLRRFPFVGHVHNLQTDPGWYVANGVIVHNCQCGFARDAAPITDDTDEEA